MSLAATITAAVGQLSGAAGQVLGGMSAGTAECGARPVLAKNRDEWNACVARNTAIREQATMNNRTTEQPATNPLVIVAVVAVVVVVLILLFRKK